MNPAIRFLLEDIVAYGSEALQTVGDLDAVIVRQSLPPLIAGARKALGEEIE